MDVKPKIEKIINLIAFYFSQLKRCIMVEENIGKNIAKLLAVLVAENNSYTYVDKLGYAPSKDLVLYYLREALRDFHSLKNKTQWDCQKAFEEVGKIDMEFVERDIEGVAKISSMKELREVVSLITARALSTASRLMS